MKNKKVSALLLPKFIEKKLLPLLLIAAIIEILSKRFNFL